MRVMRVLSVNGDSVRHEWEETTSPEHLAEIEAEFNQLMRREYVPLLVKEGLQQKMAQFDPNAEEILFIAPLIGG